MRRRFGRDAYGRYWSAKIVTYALALIAVVALVALWAPLGGRLSVILGFAAAGVAFAMQEVIGALFGWVNILAGRIYTVGDRVELAGVRGDVMDITPLRTKIMEVGGGGDGAPRSSWITARQSTGRVVALSNRKTFTDPVFNYSAHFEWIWDELKLSVPYDAEWRAAERIVLEEISAHEPALRRRGERALADLADRYIVSRAELAPRTYVRMDDHAIEITGRFVTGVRTARAAKDAISRRVLERLEQKGIPTAWTHPVELTSPATVRAEAGRQAVPSDRPG
ncbi:MAG: mechanosensitive ion channel family protein [Thermoleophilaceae bacterium]|nr:mechanosensitive ion channel family protein [Thermoleophilaceae bacterium]